MRIAVVGAGISGLVAAYLLCEEHEVTVFEQNDYIGGHTRTVDVASGGQNLAVDTGFIVFNEKTYPNFIRLLKKLDVPWQPSVMSFSVQCEKTGLEFSPSTLNSLFAQRRNLLRPAFYRMLWDVFRFKQEAPALLQESTDSQTLGNYLKNHKYSRFFIDNFIIPMGGAIWSTDPQKFFEFPARYFVQFFTNHGFLNVRDQPRWLVVRGGSQRYVEKLIRPFQADIQLNCPIKTIRRGDDAVHLTLPDGTSKSFDNAVIAVHSDQALAMLENPDQDEQEILGAIPYQANRVMLHTDRSLLPLRRSVWASWNYHIPSTETGRATVTYDMNILQTLKASDEFLVTLNREDRIDRQKVIQDLLYHHPLYAPLSLAARKRLAEINGRRRTYYCGAYWGYGFHEDGVNSALEVCKHFGKGMDG
ncbi:NAD(P)/FAD-dependent oxidoreductase [Thermodesulfobacteriota bacterium]